MRLGGAFLLLALVSCGSPPPPAYSRQTEAAQAAAREGRHREAAEHYERAASLADKPRDAEEARYRAADAYARAGDLERAETLYRALATEAAPGERQSRADFAIAELLERSGRIEAGQAHLASAIRRHPNAGVARGALSRHLDYLREHGGTAAVLSYLAEESRASSRSELGETIAYRLARELDSSGQARPARDAYLSCAARFPYPVGAYWDDALLRAAQKELELGAPAQAIAHLERMLAEQETASIAGSYERARYAEAQLELGRIYRDVLHDSARARRELHKVWLLHPQSQLVDDALFQEALIARGSGDHQGSCTALTILVQQRPASRYAPCAHLLCTAVAPMASACRDYIKREAGLP